jgi:adenosylcobinamide-phosphate synthase
MSPASHALVVLGGALAVDLFVGEPPNALHPVVWMGRFYRALRRRAPALGRAGRPAAAFAYGAFMALAGPVGFGVAAWAAIRALAPWPPLQLALEIYLLKSAFAIRALGGAAAAVARALAAGDLSAARAALRSLVSRDPATLSAPLVAAAAVESVAENASDSWVAPLVYFVVGGVPAALAYRACNTLDALIGYHGETEWLGKPAARLDDAANLVPARLTAALVVAASALAGASASGAARIWWRDGGATESPNAGRPMAAMAGALGVQLEKVGHYRLGDAGAALDAAAVMRAVAVVYVACALAALSGAALIVVRHAS